MAGVQGSPLSHSMGTDTTLHVRCICREGREGGREGREGGRKGGRERREGGREEGREGGRKGGREGRRGGLENNNLLFANGIFCVCTKIWIFDWPLLLCTCNIFHVHV